MSKKLEFKIGEQIGEVIITGLAQSKKGRQFVSVKNLRNGLEGEVLLSSFKRGKIKLWDKADAKKVFRPKILDVKIGDTNEHLEIVSLLGPSKRGNLVFVKNIKNGLFKAITATQFINGYKLLSHDERSEIRRKNNESNKKYTWKDLHEKCESLKFTAINCPEISDDYVFDSFKNNWIIKCHCGREFAPLLANVLKGGVRSCGCVRSWAQIEINNFINELGFKTEYDKKIISPLQLDVYIPEIKLAIEYNGLHWHGENNLGSNAKFQLVDKLKKCQEKDIRLIVIFEDEWLNKKDQVKAYLKAILKSKLAVIGARKCSITNTGAKELCKKWHIQSDANGLEYSLIYNNEVVASAIFAKPNASRANYETEAYELVRYCANPEMSIPGALSKLINSFKKEYPDVQKLISYSDNRWSIGNLYQTIGFKLTNHGTPSYWYFKAHDQFKRYHRYTFRKSVLIKKYNADPNKTEWQIAQENGWDRIWDLGAARWELSLK